jgi:uncharacterized phage protein (TIGR01671 family)
MRELKFRGKSKRTGRFIYGDLLTSPNGLLQYIVQKQLKDDKAFWINLQAEEVDYDTVGECTGLHDKNGKEIYEDDILDVDGHKRLCKVIWFAPQACFDTVPIKVLDERTAFRGLQNGDWSYRTEVVGNTYDNPELSRQEG